MEKDENNAALQADEIQALSAIFEKDWIMEDAIHKVYSINISNMEKTVHLQVILPESYPLDSPPIYQISAPWMSRKEKKNLCFELEEVYCQNIGQSIIYLWIETIRSFINANSNEVRESNDVMGETLLESDILLNACKISDVTLNEIPPVEHGEPIIDRKSVFQAHVAKVVSVEQVNQVVQKLKENRKISMATHNILAYRIVQGNSKTFIQDFDDDGETKAGSSLLHLLQILDVSDVLVVVSRWYGGIHLGPDRFKHINNAARTLLCKAGYILEKPSKHEKPHKR